MCHSVNKFSEKINRVVDKFKLLDFPLHPSPLFSKPLSYNFCCLPTFQRIEQRGWAQWVFVGRHKFRGRIIDTWFWSPFLVFPPSFSTLPPYLVFRSQCTYCILKGVSFQLCLSKIWRFLQYQNYRSLFHRNFTPNSSFFSDILLSSSTFLLTLSVLFSF